jgi:hypothetical protein
LGRGEFCGSEAPDWATVSDEACTAWLESLPPGAGSGAEDGEEGDVRGVYLTGDVMRAISNGFYRNTLQQLTTVDEVGQDLPACEVLWNVLNGTLREGSQGDVMTERMAASTTNSTSSLARNLAGWQVTGLDTVLPECGQTWVGRELVGYTSRH